MVLKYTPPLPHRRQAYFNHMREAALSPPERAGDTEEEELAADETAAAVAAAEASPAEASAELHFWETAPQSLVGRRVEVLWSKGARYVGRVAAFDAANGKHHVVYDDGDHKWCVVLVGRRTIFSESLSVDAV
jgi:hypothetical protein